MINLRYHIVSITAVFLALGIGIAVGGTLIQRATVETLENRLDQQEERLDRTDGENAALRAELTERDERTAALTEQGTALFTGHVQDLPTVLVTVQGTSDDTVAATRSALRSGGASVSGTVRFTGRWEDLNDDEVADLAELLDRRITNADVVHGLVLGRLADEMAAAAGREPEPEPEDEVETEPDAEVGPEEGVEADPGPEVEGDPAEVPGTDPPEPAPPSEPLVPEATLLEGLIALGFVEFIPESAGTPLVAYGMRYVVVSDDGAVLDDSLVIAPLLDSLAAADLVFPPEGADDGEGTDPQPGEGDDPDGEVGPFGASPVIVVSPLVTTPADDPTARDEVRSSPLVEAIRSDERVGTRISTVDVIDQFIGQAAMILGLAEIEAGRSGHYGLAPDATALLPAGRP